MRFAVQTNYNSVSKPDHLPTWPVNPEGYHRLYSFNNGVDDYTEETGNWQELRILANLTEAEVYKRLPSAADFEFGGYLTKTRIRYLRCGSVRANTYMAKLCTFHSHPTGLAQADVPSERDVYAFLAFRHLRTITVGRTQLWVLDKTKKTLATVRKLAAWSEANQLREAHQLEKKFPYNWHDPLIKLILKNLGLVWPKSYKDLRERWPGMLRNILKIKVRIMPRNIRVPLR